MKNWHCSKHLPIILLPAAALLIGFFIIKNYGERWDEADIYRYGDYAINAYAFILHPHNLPTFNTILSLFGPAYYAITDLTARFLTLVIPSWSIANAWHFVYFLLFPGNARAVHLLCLFQLLLWGHAFINPKDVPFMAFFAVTIYAGLKMTDHYQDSRKLGMTLVVAAVLLVLTILFRVVGSPAGLIVLVYAPFKLGARKSLKNLFRKGVRFYSTIFV